MLYEAKKKENNKIRYAEPKERSVFKILVYISVLLCYNVVVVRAVLSISMVLMPTIVFSSYNWFEVYMQTVWIAFRQHLYSPSTLLLRLSSRK